MAFTTADLDVLDRAIASSELTVEIQGRKVTFDSFEGLKARRNFIAEAIAAAQRPTGSFRYQFKTQRGD